jgi:hypothetical protein
MQRHHRKLWRRDVIIWRDASLGRQAAAHLFLCASIPEIHIDRKAGEVLTTTLLRAGDLQSVRTCLMAAAAAAASSLHFITTGIGDNLNILPILVCAPGCRVSCSEVR